MKQKGFARIVVLIVVLILAGFVGVYFFVKPQTPKPQIQNQVVVSPISKATATPSSAPNETANWKTYTDSKYFSFKFPSDWYVYDYTSCIEGSNGASAVAISRNPKNAMCDTEMTIALWQKPENVSCYPSLYKTVSNNNFSIDNQQAKQVVIKNPRGTDRNETIIGINHNNYCYTVTNVQQLVQGSIFNQILSTFKFIDQKSPTCEKCPQFMPPAPDFCKNGTIVLGKKDACDCQGPPDCKVK